MATPPSLKLFARNIFGEEPELKEDIERERNSIERRLEELEKSGTISGFEIFTKAWDRMMSPEHRNNRGGSMKFAIDKYDEFSHWASKNGLSLRPHFNQVDTLDGMIRFPDLCLAAYDGLNVRGVFPCSDENTVYTVDDYLTAIEQGEDWRDWKQGNQSLSPDWGAHGDVKLHIVYNPDEIVGKEWEFVVDEYSVQSGQYEEERGRIDLVFKHTRKEKFLLIEVKPNRDEVDAAFGQALRYRYQFLGDRNVPGLGPEDVELAIAAPDFYESHRRAAQEIGVQLLSVG